MRIPANRSLRLRLTLLYSVFFALLFILFSAIFYRVLADSLYDRLNRTLASEADTAAGLLADEFQEEGGKAELAAKEVVEDMKLHGDVVIVTDAAQHRVLASTAPLGPHTRAIERRMTLAGVPYTVTIAAPLRSTHEELELVRNTILIGLPAALALAGFGAWILATGALRPLRALAEQARDITENSLHRRLAVPDAAAELNIVIAGFNDLLSRLDRSFETMRRFVADASHELRTPVSVIRGEADVSLSRERSASEYRETLGVILDESRRLSTLIDDLLNLARADASALRLETERFYLNELISDCCRAVRARAAARNLTLECEAGDDVPFRGDERLLRRLVLNLLDNAVRYTPAGGSVTAGVEVRDGKARIRVADTGIGISAEHLPRIFERFYRADAARSRADGGFGLGLSIVQWIAEVHGGSVECVSGRETGSTFTVTLPLA